MNSSFKEQKPHNNTKKMIEATVNTTTVPMNFGCVGRAIFYLYVLVDIGGFPSENYALQQRKVVKMF